MPTPRLVLPLALIMAACGPPSPGPQVQALLDAVAPDLRIGGRVSDAARERYDLQVAPYAGYRDSLYTTHDGLSDLVVWLDEYVDDGDPRISPRARIERVSLQVMHGEDLQQLIMRIEAVLGASTTTCYRTVPGGSFLARYWPGESDRGVLVVARRPEPTDEPQSDPRLPAVGTGFVTFGAKSLSASVDLESCPTDSHEANLGATP